MRSRLDDRLGLSWSNAPLRESLENLGRANHVAVLIDRRVDPGQRVSLSVDGVPLFEAVAKMARQQGLAVCLYNAVLYVTPSEAGERLRTVAALRTDEIRKLPLAKRQPWIQTEPLAWPNFTEPKKLIAQIAQRGGISLGGIDQLPHDLWAAADLPPMSLVDAITLVAGQYDLTFRPGPGPTEAELVPIPDDVALVRSYSGGRETESLVRRFQSAAPAAEFKVIGNKIYVRGLLADHERIMDSRRNPEQRPVASRTQVTPPAPADPLADKRFTIHEAKGTARQILEHLGKQLGLEMRIDPANSDRIETALETYVEVSVEQAKLDQLLQEVFEPTGLEFRRDGKELAIRLDTPEKP